MPSFHTYLVRGVLLIIVSLPIGLAHNTIRSNSLPLVAKEAPVKASHAAGEEGEELTDAALYPEGIVSLEQTKSLLESKRAIFIDARAEEEYAAGHIPGSINIPYDQIIEYYDLIQETLPKEGLILCYCWSPTCDFSDILAKELRMMGYERVIVFREGWEAWEEAGYAVEAGAPLRE